MARFVRPSSTPLPDPSAEPDVDPSDFMSHYPALLEFLTLRQWEDGTPRETGTLTLFQGPDGLQAALNDKDGGLVAFVTDRSFTGLLGCLERGLGDGSLQWRQSRGQRNPKKR